LHICIKMLLEYLSFLSEVNDSDTKALLWMPGGIIANNTFSKLK